MAAPTITEQVNDLIKARDAVLRDRRRVADKLNLARLAAHAAFKRGDQRGHRRAQTTVVTLTRQVMELTAKATAATEALIAAQRRYR